MKLDMTVHIWSEGRQYVAHAMPLDVMSSGPTPEAARQALDEAVRAFLLTAADIGTLEEVLEGPARSDPRIVRRGQDGCDLLAE
jgi:hypothetical protein